MPITPETKSWTWVLDRPCEECGFDATSVSGTDVAGIVRANAAAWPAVLARADVTRRPDDATWSPLEYAAHVRDVFRLYHSRLVLMLEEDDPVYPNWDQDAASVAERYNEQDPVVVSRELLEAAGEIAEAFDSVPASAWSRPGRRSDGMSFTVTTFARYFVHDVVHHLEDVSRAE